MNVSCGQCHTVFRVDPDKVPAAGVRARCSVCSGVFWVRREAAEAPPPAPPPAPAPIPVPLPRAEPLPAQPPFRMPAPAYARPGPPPAPPAAAAPPPGPAVSPAPRRAPAPTVVPPLAPPAAATAPARPTNPFLSQDPKARARRLARALVSDIVVYHPAKRRDGLRDGSLKLLFEDEIRKSWEEYVEQVGHELADSTTFFTDALNDILADGQPVFP